MGLEVAAAAIGTAALTQTTATGVGLAISAGGLGATIYGQVQQAEASKKAEALRRQQMELNSMREFRQIIRNAQRAQSQALTNSTAAGAQFSSALPGGYGQIQGEAGSAISANRQNLDIGRGLFQANAQASNAKAISAIGSGAYQLGRDIISVGPEIGRLKSTIFDNKQNIEDSYYNPMANWGYL